MQKKELKLNPDLQNIFDNDFSSLKPKRNNKTCMNKVKVSKFKNENYFDEVNTGMITNRID